MATADRYRVFSRHIFNAAERERTLDVGVHVDDGGYVIYSVCDTERADEPVASYRDDAPAALAHANRLNRITDEN